MHAVGILNGNALPLFMHVSVACCAFYPHCTRTSVTKG